MVGNESRQPIPYGPFPPPESYERVKLGWNAERPGLTHRGAAKEAVPVAGFADSFSPIPRIAPPALGRVICGASTADFRSVWSVAPRCSALRSVLAFTRSRPLGLTPGDRHP